MVYGWNVPRVQRSFFMSPLVSQIRAEWKKGGRGLNNKPWEGDSERGRKGGYGGNGDQCTAEKNYYISICDRCQNSSKPVLGLQSAGYIETIFHWGDSFEAFFFFASFLPAFFLFLSVHFLCEDGCCGFSSIIWHSIRWISGTPAEKFEQVALMSTSMCILHLGQSPWHKASGQIALIAQILKTRGCFRTEQPCTSPEL